MTQDCLPHQRMRAMRRRGCCRRWPRSTKDDFLAYAPDSSLMTSLISLIASLMTSLIGLIASLNTP